MKIKAITLFAAIFFLSLRCATAQTSFSSKEMSLWGPASDKELVSHANHTNHIVSYRHLINASGVRHYFIVHNVSTNAAYQFPMSAGYHPNGASPHDTTYTINDIAVCDDGYCWFCGKEEITTGSGTYFPGQGWVNNTVSHGFVGKFLISDVVSGSGHFQISTILETSELIKMVANDNYLSVFAIGYPANTTSTSLGTTGSCIVSVDRPPLSNPCLYDVVQTIDSTEIFTDITDVGAGVVVVSRFAGDNYSIGLRHTKNGPLRDNDNFMLLKNCNKYNTLTSLSTVIHPHPIYRKDSDPLILSTGQYGECQSVSHSNDHPLMKGIVNYQLDYSMGNVTITSVRAIYSPNYLSLKEGIATTTNTQLLADNAANGTWDLFSFNWNNPSATGSPRAFFSKSASTCMGLSTFSVPGHDTYTYVGGHNNSGYFNCYLFNNIVSSGAQCFDGGSFVLNNFTTPTYSKGKGVQPITHLEGANLTFRSYSFNSTPGILQTNCTY